jgi:hypothetical protein
MSIVMDYVLHLMANPMLFNPPPRQTACKFPNADKTNAFVSSWQHEDIQTNISYRQLIANNTHLNILTCDYPGSGFSTEHPSEAGMHHAALAMLDFATSTLKQNPADIIVIGKSIGSTPAIGFDVNSYCQDLCGLVFLSPVASGGLSRLENLTA